MTKTSKNQRQGGPQTEAGKAICARNSTKIGVYSNQIILPGEDPEAFAELEALFVADFKPVGVTEASLVHEIAVLTWKKRRLDGIEHQYIAHQLTAPVQSLDLLKLSLPRMEGNEKYVLNPELIDDSDMAGLLISISALSDFLGSDADVSDFMALQAAAPAVFDRLQNAMADCGFDQATPKTMAEFEEEGRSEGSSEGYLFEFGHELLAELIDQESLANQKALFVDAHQRLRASRLASSVTSERNERAHDHLSRSFYKTLTELRKQQDWRRQQQVIDVTPEHTPLAA